MTSQPTPWPTVAPYTVAIEAFDSALTRAAYDEQFRNDLKTSSESARAAIAAHANLTIPEDRVFVFYEPQSGVALNAPADAADADEKQMIRATASKSSELVHIFCLPPLNANDQSKEYKYEDWFRCCYDQWLRE